MLCTFSLLITGSVRASQPDPDFLSEDENQIVQSKAEEEGGGVGGAGV